MVGILLSLSGLLGLVLEGMRPQPRLEVTKVQLIRRCDDHVSNLRKQGPTIKALE